MGDHLCAGPTAELSPPLDSIDEFESQFSKPPYPKHGTPPPVETGSMGQTYMHRGQLTPVSQPSESRDASPVYPNRRESSRRAHESFGSRQLIDARWETPMSANPSTRSGGYGGFEETNRENFDKPLSGGFMARMNTSVPGPFDPMRPKNSYPQRNDSLEKLVPSEEPLPPRQPRKDGYGGFGAPKNLDSNGSATLSRSETYPKLSPTTNYFQTQRVTSAPGSHPERLRTGGGHGHEYKRSIGPDTSRKPPPRTSLLPEYSLRNAGSVDLAAEFGIGNPYHTPSDSASSVGYSDSSRASRSTAVTSPTSSEIYQADQNRDMNEAGFSTDKLKPKDLRIDPFAAASRTRSPRMVESPYGLSPTTQFDGALGNDPRRPPSRAGYSTSPTQDSNYTPAGFRNDHGLTEHTSPQRQHTWERQGSPKRLAFPSRGDCKSCGLAIQGKSISSADGRLTGKYHKACFVCTTCAEPFSSSVFYVLGDKPYCEQHYHELNGSLCGDCGRGIEGQYLEDEARVKYHVGCFRCLDCGVSLSQGYFEVDGRSYCERDAWQRVQPAASLEPEPYRRGPPRGAVGTRIPQGLPARPAPRLGQGGRPLPPPPNGIPNGGRLGVGAGQQFKMNKRMTRLGNMNL
ncbi:LIM domain-containing protein, partial [Metarhizium hybridum]